MTAKRGFTSYFSLNAPVWLNSVPSGRKTLHHVARSDQPCFVFSVFHIFMWRTAFLSVGMILSVLFTLHENKRKPIRGSTFRGGDSPTFSFITGNGQISDVAVTTANGYQPPGPSRHPQAAAVSRASAFSCDDDAVTWITDWSCDFFQTGDTSARKWEGCSGLAKVTPTFTWQPLLFHPSVVKYQHHSSVIHCCMLRSEAAEAGEQLGSCWCNWRLCSLHSSLWTLWLRLAGYTLVVFVTSM